MKNIMFLCILWSLKTIALVDHQIIDLSNRTEDLIIDQIPDLIDNYQSKLIKNLNKHKK